MAAKNDRLVLLGTAIAFVAVASVPVLLGLPPKWYYQIPTSIACVTVLAIANRLGRNPKTTSSDEKDL